MSESTNTKPNKTTFKVFIENNFYYFYFGLLIVLAFCCFFKLESLPIADWDEARHGVNAYEMLRENNFIANFYNGTPDYWNLKPPISYYTIILGYKIFGYNTFGLRFFSALSYILTSVAISLYIKKNKGKLASLFSIILFISFSFLFVSHCVRTGDADAIFLLFFTLGFLSLLNSSNKPNQIYISAIMFALMFLTKSWHCLIFVPIVFFYLLFTKGFKTLKWYRLVIFFVICLVPIVVWVVLRYNYDKFDFLLPMVKYDLLSRSSTALEGNSQPIYFYLLYLIKYASPVLLAITTRICYMCSAKQKPTSEDLGCLISFLSVFLFFTIAKTKLSWYIFPCVVPMTIFGSNFVQTPCKKVYQKILAVLCLVTVTIFSLISIGYPIVYKKQDNVQSFINSINIEQVKGSELFIETSEQTNWTQGNLLCAELKLDVHTKNNGWNAYIENKKGYIIIENSILTPDKLELVDILYTSNNLSLCALK